MNSLEIDTKTKIQHKYKKPPVSPLKSITDFKDTSFLAKKKRLSKDNNINYT